MSRRPASMFFFLVLMLVLSNAIWFDAFSSKPISKRLSPVQTSFRRFLGVKPAGSINHAVRQNVNSDDGYGYDYYDEWEEVVMPSVEYDGTEEWETVEVETVEPEYKWVEEETVVPEAVAHETQDPWALDGIWASEEPEWEYDDEWVYAPYDPDWEYDYYDEYYYDDGYYYDDEPLADKKPTDREPKSKKPKGDMPPKPSTPEYEKETRKPTKPEKKRNPTPDSNPDFQNPISPKEQTKPEMLGSKIVPRNVKPTAETITEVIDGKPVQIEVNRDKTMLPAPALGDIPQEWVTEVINGQPIRVPIARRGLKPKVLKKLRKMMRRLPKKALKLTKADKKELKNMVKKEKKKEIKALKKEGIMLTKAQKKQLKKDIRKDLKKEIILKKLADLPLSLGGTGPATCRCVKVHTPNPGKCFYWTDRKQRYCRSRVCEPEYTCVRAGGPKPTLTCVRRKVVNKIVKDGPGKCKMAKSVRYMYVPYAV